MNLCTKSLYRERNFEVLRPQYLLETLRSYGKNLYSILPPPKDGRFRTLNFKVPPVLIFLYWANVCYFVWCDFSLTNIEILCNSHSFHTNSLEFFSVDLVLYFMCVLTQHYTVIWNTVNDIASRFLLTNQKQSC